MSEGDQIWLVAGGEPGAERFGQLVQRLRKEHLLSVEDVAAKVDLSVGTIRAIEQGRRAPSQDSGVRLLQLLLPAGEFSREQGARQESGLHPDYSFTDPQSGSRVLLVFRAKIAGDNRRWSSDRPRAGESKAETFMRELMNDPTRFEEVSANLVPALQIFASAASELKLQAMEPATDADLGGIMRRLVTVNQARVWHLKSLLDLWDRVDTGISDAHEREIERQLNDLLAGYTVIPDDKESPASE